MIAPSTAELPKPKDWDEFEELVWDLYRRKWNDPEAERYGRSGQEQQGVDIYGRPKGLQGEYVGVQCKRYKDLTISVVKKEIPKADGFVSKLKQYIIATTDERDAKLQRAVRLINQDRERVGDFSVRVMFWEDLCNGLVEHDDLLRKHFSQWYKVFGGEKVHLYKPPAPPGKGELPPPGRLPPGSRVPFGRNAVFTGREGDLLSLADDLLYAETGEQAVGIVGTPGATVAAGMGGIGKS